MRRLADAREHLDGRLADAEVLAGNLRDLRRINRLFGGTGLSLRALRALLRAHPLSPRADVPLRILDVGTGAADIPLAILRSLGPTMPVEVTAIDARTEIVDAALALTSNLRSTPNLTLAVADGLDLPFTDAAFDIAHASLVLHHLEPGDAIRLLRELGRVAGSGVVINDLARSRHAWLGAWLVLHAMTRNPFTLHDGPLSVRRAYTPAEARALLAQAGLRPVAQATGLAGHRWAIAAVPRLTGAGPP